MIGAVQTVLVGPLLFVPGAGCLAAGTASAESIAIPASRDTTLIEDAEGARSNGAGPCFAGRVSAPDDPRRRASRHALRLILSGVFDDYPRLKIVIGHMGEGLPVAGAWIAAFRVAPDAPRCRGPRRLDRLHHAEGALDGPGVPGRERVLALESPA